MKRRWRQRLSELPDQFVLDENERPPFETWVTQPVGSWFLHTHPRTELRELRGRDGEKARVIGTMIAGPDTIISSTDCPAGQFVVVTPRQVYSDVGSLMPAFFHRKSRRIGSSLRLLAGPDERPVAPEILHGSRPDWYWAPRTTFPEIDYLLPSQRLDLATFEPIWRPLPEPSSAPLEQALALLERELVASFRQLAEDGNAIRIAMTGGIDGRTLFAAAIAAGVPFETYTMASGHVHPRDLEIAGKISNLFGIRHQILPMGPVDPEDLDFYLWAAAGQTVTLDADFHASGLWRALGPGAMSVRGLAFTLGREKYRGLIERGDETIVLHNPREIWRRFTKPWVRQLHRYNRQAFDSYAQWLASTLDCSMMELSDRLFIEQGMGGWDASAEYGLAATGVRRIAPANSTRIFELLLQKRDVPMTAGPLQREMIARIDQRLLGFPFVKPNVVEKFYFRALDTVRALRVRRRLRRLG